MFAANFIHSQTSQKGDLQHPAALVSKHLGEISPIDLALLHPGDAPVVPEYSPKEYLTLTLQV